MIFAPICLGSVSLPKETAVADKRSCKRFGPCGVGKEALYLSSYFIDRRYYVPLTAVRRAFKRVAMSRGGFTGKGIFGAITYLVVQYGDGSEKQCTFKHEEDVDNLLAYLSRIHPEIPVHSVEAERRLAEKAEREAQRYLKELTPEAQSARESLEKAKNFLSGYPELTGRLSAAAKAKRVNQRTNPAYKWVALAIVLLGLVVAVYGIIAWRRHEDFGVYVMLLGLAVVFLFSGTQVIPTMKNNKRAVAKAYDAALEAVAAILPEKFPLPVRYAHPVVLERMIRVLREGRAHSEAEALDVVKADLKALTADVQVEQEEYDEVVAIKPMFLLHDYQ